MTISTLTDLVKVYTPTSGQGALILGAAVPGFLTPSTVIPAMTSGSLVSYGIADPSGNEVGQGILTLTGSVWTLTRGVTQSSNGGAPILCTGQATVALTLRAEDVFQGWTKIASGVITTPLAFFDVALPPNSARFRIEALNFRFSAAGADSFAMALSFDGGITWPNDMVNMDTYYFPASAFLQATGSFFHSFVDTNLDIGLPAFSNQKTGNTILIDLIPGDSASLATVFFTNTAAAGGGSLEQNYGAGGLNPSATIAPPLARATNLRILPYGNGDVNPPTSGNTIVSGSYIVWGSNL